MLGFPLFPDQASTFAWPLDALYFGLIALSVIFGMPVVVLLVYFGVKYRRGSPADRTETPHTSMTLELAWIVIPLVTALAVFVWAASLYFHMIRPPADTLDVYVVGKQWMWKFQHPDGQSEINELHVPLGSRVRLTMTSQDVIHSLYVPAFRVKQDVLPGRSTTLWFEATRTGEYHLFCAEYCGTQHSGMIGRVVVMDPAEYQAWLAGGSAAVGGQAPLSPAAGGEQAFQQFGCTGCHRADNAGAGPSLVGIYGKPVPLEGGGTATADDNYIIESILNPNAQIVAGYQPIMPSFDNQITEEQMLQLVAYIKSLGGGEEGGAPAQTTDQTAQPAETAEAAGTAQPAETAEPTAAPE